MQRPIYCIVRSMHFDFVDLSLMTALADTKNLARAASRCHLSAPAASNRVKNLEEGLGFRLLYRTSQGMTLTPAGESFVRHARIVLEQTERLAADMQDYGEGIKGHVRVWANTTAISEFLPAALSRFLREHQDVNIELREVLSSEIIKGLVEGATDIGIVASNVDIGHLETLPYHDDQLVLVTAPDHPLANRESIDFAETLDEDFVGLSASSVIHSFINNVADSLGRRVKLRIEVGNFEAACRMIAAGVGIGIVPGSVAIRHAKTMNIRIVLLNDAWSQRKLKICVRSLKDLPQFSRKLVDMLTAEAE